PPIGFCQADSSRVYGNRAVAGYGVSFPLPASGLRSPSKGKLTPFNRPIRASFPGAVRRVLREADTYIFANEYGLCKRVSGGLTSERERPCWQSLEGMQESKTTRTKRRNKARSRQIFAL